MKSILATIALLVFFGIGFLCGFNSSKSRPWEELTLNDLCSYCMGELLPNTSYTNSEGYEYHKWCGKIKVIDDYIFKPIE